MLRVTNSESDRFEPATVRPIGTTAASKLDDFMISHTINIGSSAFNQVRFSQNEIDADPTVTSGITNAEYGLNIPNINPIAVGLPQFAISGFPSMG